MLQRTLTPCVMAVLVVGCGGTRYHTKANGLLHQEVVGAKPVYVVDGQQFDVSAWDAGLVEAVKSDPVALGYAQSARSNSMIGSGLLIGALVAIAATPLALDFSGNSVQNLTGYATLLGLSLVLDIAAIPFLISAGTDRFDAINAFNDAAVERALVARKPPPEPEDLNKFRPEPGPSTSR